jgi:hypothetical protein
VKVNEREILMGWTCSIDGNNKKYAEIWIFFGGGGGGEQHECQRRWEDDIKVDLRGLSFVTVMSDRFRSVLGPVVDFGVSGLAPLTSVTRKLFIFLIAYLIIIVN